VVGNYIFLFVRPMLPHEEARFLEAGELKALIRAPETGLLECSESADVIFNITVESVSEHN